MAWAPLYATRDEFKDYARIDDTEDDNAIDVALGMAARAIDKQCGRQFGQTASEAREYTPWYSRSRAGYMVEVDDFVSATPTVSWDVNADGTFATSIASSAVVPWPRNAAQEGKPYERLLFRPNSGIFDTRAFGLRVVTAWGWATVPAAVHGAQLLQVNRMHARRDAPFGVAGSPDSGSEVRLLAQLDPDVRVALEWFKRRAWAR